MEPLKVFVFDSSLFQMTYRYINWRRDLTDRNIFSSEFLLTAKLCSGHRQLTAISINRKQFFGVFFFMTFRHIFSGEFWPTGILYSGQWRLAAILTAASQTLNFNILGHESGGQVVLIHGKNQRSKISCYCHFKWTTALDRLSWKW
jgi:hypothetical protein